MGDVEGNGESMPCKQVLLANHSSKFVREDDFHIVEATVQSKVKPGSKDVLVKNLYLSVDPWNRLCMHATDQGLCAPPFEIGKPISVWAVAKVIASDNNKYSIGEYLEFLSKASEYWLLPGGLDSFGLEPRKIKIDPKIPLEKHLGPLGLPGMTAWTGLIEVAQIKTGDEVFVSAAAGGVGLVAGQLAKAKNCRVVGSAGSDEKVELLKELGFDGAFNYKKEPDWDATLCRLFPNGIDVYIDNVGGRMLEAVLNHIKRHGRVAISGMISQYDQDWKDSHGVRNLMNLVGRCAKLEGFLANYTSKEFFDEMPALVMQGRIKSRETITDGIQNLPKAFVGMMKGDNVGKALIRV